MTHVTFDKPTTDALFGSEVVMWYISTCFEVNIGDLDIFNFNFLNRILTEKTRTSEVGRGVKTLRVGTLGSDIGCTKTSEVKTVECKLKGSGWPAVETSEKYKPVWSRGSYEIKTEDLKKFGVVYNDWKVTVFTGNVTWTDNPRIWFLPVPKEKGRVRNRTTRSVSLRTSQSKK